jgi:hypothetical protein
MSNLDQVLGWDSPIGLIIFLLGLILAYWLYKSARGKKEK